MRWTADRLVKHVGCGTVDDVGACPICELIRVRLRRAENLEQQIATLAEAIGNYAEDLRSRTWLAPVSAEEMNTRDRWLAGKLDEIRRSVL